MKLFNSPIKILIIVCILCFCNSINAQDDPGLPGDGSGGGDVTDNPAPITGLIPLAILAGAGIGIYGLNQKKKK